MQDIDFNLVAMNGSGDTNATVATPTKKQNIEISDFSKILDQAVSVLSGLKNTSMQTNEGLSIGTTHSRHFPMNESEGKEKISFQQKMLGVRAYRQQIIASNIANADTPGYKAVDIDVREAKNQNKFEPLPLITSSPNHTSGNFIDKSPPLILKYHTPTQASADGNTVEMDVERNKFAENSLMYQFSLDSVRGEFNDMKKLLSELK